MDSKSPSPHSDLPLCSASPGTAFYTGTSSCSDCIQQHLPITRPTCGQLIPPISSIVILSSLESGGPSGRRNPGSTSIRRQSSSTHAALDDAIKTTMKVMVAQMKEMVGAT